MRQASLLFWLLLLGDLCVQGAQMPAVLRQSSAEKHPFSAIGQLSFNSGRSRYIGSGVAIGARSVLTAGHNLYDPDQGFSSSTEFYRASYGTAVGEVQRPTQRFLLAGYRTASSRFNANHIRAFAFDAGGLSFAESVNEGRRLPYTADRGYLNLSHYQILLGYGAEGSHNGDFPLFLTPTRQFQQVIGSFYESTSIYVEGGMSGGPFFSQRKDGVLFVVGIVVSSSTEPIAGGVRLLDAGLVRLIRGYLP